jgi:hypothetical protein
MSAFGEFPNEGLQREGCRRPGRDHLEPVTVRNGSVEVFVVDLGRRPQLVKDVVAAARVPVHSERDFNAALEGGGNVRGLGVEDEIASGGPDQLSACGPDLLELGVTEGGPVDGWCPI